MQVFLSWSGQRSQEVAKAFADWLPTVLFSIKPWMSSSDIDKGGTWITSIKDALQQSAGIGLFFVTREALASPWLLFEAGSIASLGHQRVCVLYVEIETSEVQPPLSLFQGTKLVKDDINALVRSLNKSLSPPMDDGVLATTFERGWPDLEKQISSILSTEERAPKKGRKPNTDQVLADIAETTQRIEVRLSNLERRSALSERFAVHQGITPRRERPSAEIRERRAKFFGMSRPELEMHMSRISPQERESICAALGYESVDALMRGYTFRRTFPVNRETGPELVDDAPA